MPGSAPPGSGHENQSQPNDSGSQSAMRNAKAGDVGPATSRGPNAGSRPDFERGGERAQTDNAPGHEQRSFQTPPGAGTQAPHENRYDPDSVQATREQGLGMGERDLQRQRQRDPHRPAPPPEEDSRPDGE